MKRLTSGESATREVIITLSEEITERTAAVTHAWKKDKDAIRYQLKFTYLFDIPLESVYKYAALWINKDYQNRMRGETLNEKALEKLEQSPISVKEMYTAKPRTERDPVKAAHKALESLSKEECDALVSEFMSKEIGES